MITYTPMEYLLNDLRLAELALLHVECNHKHRMAEIKEQHDLAILYLIRSRDALEDRVAALTTQTKVEAAQSA
jgi:hypothetical protein